MVQPGSEHAFQLRALVLAHRGKAAGFPALGGRGIIRYTRSLKCFVFLCVRLVVYVLIAFAQNVSFILREDAVRHVFSEGFLPFFEFIGIGPVHNGFQDGVFHKFVHACDHIL